MFNIQKTKQDIIKDELIKIDAMSRSGLYQLAEAHKTAYNLFWNNELGITPQDFCDFMGSDAYKLFVASKKGQDFLKEMDSEHEELKIPKGKDATINKDGTVIITELPTNIE